MRCDARNKRRRMQNEKERGVSFFFLSLFSTALSLVRYTSTQRVGESEKALGEKQEEPREGTKRVFFLSLSLKKEHE